jgi:hypothetical protein
MSRSDKIPPWLASMECVSVLFIYHPGIGSDKIGLILNIFSHTTCLDPLIMLCVLGCCMLQYTVTMTGRILLQIVNYDR